MSTRYQRMSGEQKLKAAQRLRDWRKKHPEFRDKDAQRDRERLYGLTPAKYKALFLSQSGLCAICRRPPQEGRSVLDVDHDHVTGKVRGLLCGPCNRGIGQLDHDARRLVDAAIYLDMGIILEITGDA